MFYVTRTVGRHEPGVAVDEMNRKGPPGARPMIARSAVQGLEMMDRDVSAGKR